MPEARIRPATKADLPHMQKLLEAEHMPLFELQNFLETLWVLDDGGEVTGCIGLELYGASALLRSIVVSPAARGTGGGHRLVSHLLDEARRRGAKTMYLFTMDKAPFFSRYGFQTCAMDDWDDDIRQCTQYRGLLEAPQIAAILTTMRLTL